MIVIAIKTKKKQALNKQDKDKLDPLIKLKALAFDAVLTPKSKLTNVEPTYVFGDKYAI